MPVSCGVSLDETAYLKALKARHAAIDTQIQLEQNAPSVSESFLKILKKKKLFLKEKIEGIRGVSA